jgi:hypothetical protein
VNLTPKVNCFTEILVVVGQNAKAGGFSANRLEWDLIADARDCVKSERILGGLLSGGGGLVGQLFRK